MYGLSTKCPFDFTMSTWCNFCCSSSQSRFEIVQTCLALSKRDLFALDFNVARYLLCYDKANPKMGKRFFILTRSFYGLIPNKNHNKMRDKITTCLLFPASWPYSVLCFVNTLWDTVEFHLRLTFLLFVCMLSFLPKRRWFMIRVICSSFSNTQSMLIKIMIDC